MRTKIRLASLGVAALLFLCSGPLWAQNMSFNGDFEVGSIAPSWTLTGGNLYTQLTTFQTKVGVDSLCIKRQPGPPSSNGNIEQTVQLIGGVQYVFTADICAQYCST